MRVPESVRFLLNRGQLAEAHRIVSDIERQAGITPAEKAVMPAGQEALRFSFRDLWSPMLAKRTLMLWLLWFGIVYSYYGIFTWLPSLMVGKGYTVIKTFEYILIMTLAQLPGYFSAAYFVEVVGRKITLAVYLAFSAVFAYLFGQGGEPWLVLLWGSLMSFFNLGAWGVVYTYTPELYPTRIRAYGSGWAAAVGRFGGIFAPVAVAYVLAGDGGFGSVFGMFTGVMLFTAAAVFLLGEETRGKQLDEISR